MGEMILQRGCVEETPELVGYDSSRIDALNAHLWRMIDDHRLIGASYCIAKDDKLIAIIHWVTVVTKERRQLMMPDTVMRMLR